jgi:2-dehydro-3-deoxyphosphogluconate aldolase/(4S)-4-hydroxy-2-oxoglutarate aldolase
MDLEAFKRKPLLGIVRGIELDVVEPLVESVIAGGLESLEITMNTKEAPKLIARAVEVAGERLAIGAGTVLNIEDFKRAMEAGAGFIVSPTLIREVVTECRERRIPVFPGALTPQEIFDAWRAGASMVKVFPAKFFGPEYFAEIKGPFADISLLACGGISAETLPRYAQCGADAFAVGGSVFKAAWIEAGEYSKIESSLRALVEALPAID